MNPLRTVAYSWGTDIKTATAEQHEKDDQQK
jgi:hypothetical protein